MLRPKKISYKELDDEKNSCCSKIPHSPHNFSNGPSLMKSVSCEYQVSLLHGVQRFWSRLRRLSVNVKSHARENYFCSRDIKILKFPSQPSLGYGEWMQQKRELWRRSVVAWNQAPRWGKKKTTKRKNVSHLSDIYRERVN